MSYQGKLYEPHEIIGALAHNVFFAYNDGGQNDTPEQLANFALDNWTRAGQLDRLKTGIPYAEDERNIVNAIESLYQTGIEWRQQMPDRGITNPKLFEMPDVYLDIQRDVKRRLFQAIQIVFNRIRS